jgi:hypothetical protein
MTTRERPWELGCYGVGITLALVLALATCSAGRQSLRDGVLRQGIGQKAFRAQWGEPDQVLLILNSKMLADRWDQEVVLPAPGELYVYSKYGADILVDDSGDLLAWKTNLTQEQLRAIPRR